MGQITIKSLDGKKSVPDLTKTGDHVVLATSNTFMTDDIVINAVEMGTDTSDATATAQKIVAGYTAYGADGKILGTIPEYDGQMINNKIILDLFQEMGDVRYLYLIDSYLINIHPTASDRPYNPDYDQTTILDNYIPGFMTVSGTTTAREVGTYTCTFTVPEGFTFKSTGTRDYSVQWSIIRLE